METSRDSVPERQEGGSDTVSVPLLPSKKKVAFVVLFFLVGGYFFLWRTQMLFNWVAYHDWGLNEPGEPHPYTPGVFLNLIQPVAILAASILLYFRSSRHDDPRTRRERRGEIFTGLLNLHILTLMIIVPPLYSFWKDIPPLMFTATVISFLLSTATFCLVGFHLCEGRFLLPLGGVIPGLLGLRFLAYDLWFFVPIPITAGLMVILPLLAFAWQLVTLIRSGDDFVPFPTGFWPALRTSAPVFIGTAIPFLLLFPYPRLSVELAKVFGLLGSLGSMSKEFDQRLSWMFIYLVLPFFLAWRGARFSVRIRKLTLTILTLGAVLSLTLSPFGISNVLPWYVPADIGSYYFIRWLILQLWNVLMLIGIMRWWAGDRFLWPVLLLLLIYAPLTAFLLSPTRNPWPFDYAQIAIQLATVLLLGVLLFRKVSPAGGSGAGIRAPNGDAEGNAGPLSGNR